MNLTRRDLLKLMSIHGIAGLSIPICAHKLSSRFTVSIKAAGTSGDILVCIFQRGGMDGLNAVVPYADPEYPRLRSILRIPEPQPGTEKTAIDLDGFFGLHPSLAAFKNIWDEQALAIVHATGSPLPTHSHFEAMDFMEHGSPGDKSLQTGWLARHLETAASQNESPLRAVSISTMIQASLRGSIPAVALSSVEEFRVGRRYDIPSLFPFENSLTSLFKFGSSLDAAAEVTFQAAEIVDRTFVDGKLPATSIEYPQSDFGQSLRLLAQLIKAEVGVDVATVDIDGWDTHVAEGAIEGQMPHLLSDLSESLNAFYQDMGERMNRITVVTMSEFGRRAKENAGGGTDHGHGNLMFVIGRNIYGGKVYGQWPGLAPENLVDPGDLAVTTDYRTVLAEIVQKRLMNDRFAEVFPGFAQPGFLGMAQS